MMERTEAEDKATLTSMGFGILQAFKIVLDAWSQEQREQSRDGVEYSAMLHQEERYDLWAINIGLYQSGHGSLDYRFRDAPALLLYCETLLENLRDLLQTLSAQLSNKVGEQDNDLDCDPGFNVTEGQLDEDFDDFDHDEYADQSIAQAMLEGIVDCVNRLYQLSMKVQAASRRLGSSRGYSYRRLDDETGVDLFDCFTKLRIDEMHIRHMLSSLRGDRVSSVSSNEILVARLAKANNQRRRQFGYWSQHKINLVRRSQAAKDRQVLGQPMPTPSEASKPTTATQLNPSVVNLNEDSQSATSAISIDVFDVKDSSEELEIPGPPQKYLAQDDVKEFECPYCFTACSARFLNVRKWRSHLLKDLRPYICIFDDCRNASQLYDSFSDWANHDMQHNMRLGNASGDNGNKHEPPKPADGLTSVHQKEFGRTRDCPFCLEQVGDIGAFYKHVANHLIRAALFSLPRSTGIEVDEDEDSAASDFAVRSVDDLQSTSRSLSTSSAIPSRSSQERGTERADAPHVSLSQEETVDSNSPLGKVLALSVLYYDKWLPECQQFLVSPPLDETKREKEYRRLSESVKKYIIEAADEIDVYFYPIARTQRRGLLGEVLVLLRNLDAVNQHDWKARGGNSIPEHELDEEQKTSEETELETGITAEEEERSRKNDNRGSKKLEEIYHHELAERARMREQEGKNPEDFYRVEQGRFNKEKEEEEGEDEVVPVGSGHSDDADDRESRRRRVRSANTTTTEEEKQHLPSRPQALPVRFKDALGRNYNFPFERVKEWKDMENLINQAFQHIEDIDERVTNGEYDLLGPDNEIILPEEWSETIKPDMRVKMMLWPVLEPSREPSSDPVRPPQSKRKPSSFARWMLSGSQSSPRAQNRQKLSEPSVTHLTPEKEKDDGPPFES